MVEKIKSWAESNPQVAQWIREGGLFVLVSNLISIGKAIALTFLPGLFAYLGSEAFGFPGIALDLFGVKFDWYIIGYGADEGGLAYFTAYMVAMFVGEFINFFIQRSWVFRSHGNILYQGMWYLLAFCVVTCVVNSINCIWLALSGALLTGSEWALLKSIVTTVMNGGISMVVFFVVNKIVFADGSKDQSN